MDTKIDLSGLLPNFSSLLGGIPETTQQLSDIFVWFLLIVFFSFLARAYFARGRSLGRIRWLSGLVKDQDLNNIAYSRDNFIVEAKDIKTKGGHLQDSGHLWLEFDETLVEVTNDDNSPSLRNTLDSHHFFNSSTLAAGITESRMLAAVPGFLTAVGVIGTFIGLQIGLSGLHLGNDVPISEMKTGLGVVISGAKTAFMTSVWGVFLSVAFNFTEKFFEGKVRKEIYELQTRIDYLFPRLSAECQLQRIANDSQESRESLQGLAEKIGDKMQESLLEVTSSIQSGLESSLQNVMGPAMDRLVADTSQGNEKALESLLENFMSKFGELGNNQREAMDMASHNVSNALGSLDASMSTFMQKMEASQGSSAQREQELMTTIASQVNQLVSHSHEHNQMLSQAVNQHLGGLSQTFQAHEQNSAEQNQLMVESMKVAQDHAVQREQAMVATISSQVNKLVEHSHEQRQLLNEAVGQQVSSLNETFQKHEQVSLEQNKERQAAFLAQSQAVNSSIDSMLHRVESGLDSQMTASKSIIEQGKQLQNSLDVSVKANADASMGLKDSANELNTASREIKTFGMHIQEAGNKLSGAVSNAVESTSHLADQNQQASKMMENQRQQLVDDREQFVQAAEQLKSLIHSADTSFDKMRGHQDEFLQSLKGNVSDLSDQMTKLLSGYADQANAHTASHLQEWAKGTTNYAEKMNQAANSLSSVVDEIEVKMQGRG